MSQKQKAKKLQTEQKKHKQDRNAVNQYGNYERALLYSIKTLLILAFVSPLIVVSDFFFPFVGPKSMFFMGIVQLLLAAYVLLAIYFPAYRPKFNIVTIALLAFFGALILTSLTGANFLRSFWSNYERMTGLLIWFHLIAFYIALTSVLKTKQDWSLILFSTMFFSVIVAVVFLLVRFGYMEFPLAKAGSTIGNSSFMGVYLLFNAFVAAYLFIFSKNTLKYSALASFLIIIAALFLSEALASIAAFVIASILLILLYMIFFSNKKYLRVTATFVLFALIIVSLALSVMLFVPGSMVREAFVRVDTEARLTAWAVAWRGFLERPWLGWGAENFSIPFMKHFDPRLVLPEYGAEVMFDRAHNIILDTMITSGIPGLLAYIFIFAAVFMHLLKLILQDKKNFWLSGIATVTLVAYFIQNLTVFDMINSYIMFILVLGLAAAAPLEGKIRQPEKQLRKASLLFVPAVIMAFAAVFFVFTYSPWQANRYFASTANTRTLEQLLHFYSRSINSSPLGREDLRLFLTDKFSELAISEEGKRLDRTAMTRFFLYLESELQRNIEENPYDFSSHLDFAIFYNRWALYDASKALRAGRLTDRAIELSPKNQISFWVKADTYAILGDRDKALNAAQKAIELEPRHLYSHEAAIRMAIGTGRLDIAEEKLIQALEVNPVWEAELRALFP